MRRRRAELLEQGDPGGELGRINEALDEVVDQEREAISDLQEEAKNSGDERRQAVTDDVATERRMALDLLPKDLAGKVQSLQSYDFVSSEARQRFEELMEELRQQVAQTYFEGMSEAMSNPDPAQLQHMREAMSVLNRMLEQREAGEPIDPTFEQFMEQFGDMFPGNPKTLDELLEQLAAAHGGGPGHVELAVARAAPAAAGRWPTPCSRTWTCAGRWSGWRRTCSGPSPRRAGAAATGSPARTPWAWATPPTSPPSWGSSTPWRRCCSRPPRRPR